MDTREIEPHYLDDAEYDIAEDHAEGGNYWWLFAHLVLGVALIVGWRYFEPPPIEFRPPAPPMTIGATFVHPATGASYATQVCYVGAQ